MGTAVVLDTVVAVGRVVGRGTVADPRGTAADPRGSPGAGTAACMGCRG